MKIVTVKKRALKLLGKEFSNSTADFNLSVLCTLFSTQSCHLSFNITAIMQHIFGVCSKGRLPMPEILHQARFFDLPLATSADSRQHIAERLPLPPFYGDLVGRGWHAIDTLQHGEVSNSAGKLSNTSDRKYSTGRHGLLL